MIELVLAAAISWPGQYNAGVTAYRSNDFASAATTFEQSTASPDRALQQRALYNLGNTAYRLGETQPQQAQQLWQRAIKSYESALALDPNDVDAKFNRDFVKKKLEELKQQQQQQKDQDKKQHQKKDEQQQQKQDQRQQQKQEQEKAKEQEQQNPEPKDERQQAQAQPDKLDKQEAKAALDELRENEQNWNFFPEVQMKDLKDSGPPAKDW